MTAGEEREVWKKRWAYTLSLHPVSYFFSQSKKTFPYRKWKPEIVFRIINWSFFKLILLKMKKNKQLQFTLKMASTIQMWKTKYHTIVYLRTNTEYYRMIWRHKKELCFKFVDKKNTEVIALVITVEHMDSLHKRDS